MSDLVNFDLTDGRRRSKRKPKGKRFSLRTWLVRGFWLALIVLVAGRLTLSLWLPPALRKVGHRMGVELTYQHLDLSLLGGRVSLRGLEAKSEPKSAADGSEIPAQTLAYFDYAVLDVSIPKLLRGSLRVHRAEVDGGTLHLERDAEGNWNAAEFLRNEKRQGQESNHLWQGMQWSELRLQDLTFELTDHTQSPSLETQGSFDLTLADLGFEDLPVRMELRAQAKDWCDGLHADGTLHRQPEALRANLQVEAYGLRQDLAQRLLAPLGLETEASNHGLRFQAQVDWALGSNEAGQETLQGPILLRELAFQSDHRPALIVDQFQVQSHFDGQSNWQFREASLSNAELHVERSPVGHWSLASIRPHTADQRTAGSPGLPLWDTSGLLANLDAWHGDFELDRLQCEKVRFVLEDGTHTPTAKIDVTLEGDLREIAWSGAQGWSELRVDASLQGPGLFDELVWDGSLLPTRQGHWHGRIRGQGLNLTALDPYLKPLGWQTDLSAATLQSVVRASWTNAPELLEWNLSLVDTDLKEGERRTRLGNVSLERIAWSGDRWRVGALRVESAQARLERNAFGQWILPVLRSLPSEEATQLPAHVHFADLKLARIDLEWVDAFQRETPLLQTVQISKANASPWDVRPAQGLAALQGKGQLHVKLPGLAEHIQLDCELTPGTQNGKVQSGAVHWTVSLACVGLQQAPWQERFAAWGLQADWIGSDLSAAGEGTWAQTEGGWQGDSKLSNLHFAREGKSWLKLNHLDLAKWKWNAGQWSAQEVTVSQPDFALERRTDGTWHGMGLAWSFPGSPASESAAQEPGAEAKPVGSSLASPASHTSLGFEQLPDRWRSSWPIDHLIVEGGQCDLRDASRSPAYEAELLLSGNVQTLAQDEDLRGVQVDALFGLSGSVDRAKIEGKILSDGARMLWDCDINAQGLRVGELAPYLPGPARIDLKSGTLKAKACGQWKRLPEGGVSWTLESPELLYEQSPGGRILASWRDLNVVVDRWDSERAVYELGPTRVRQLQADILRNSDGSLSAVGFAWPAPVSQEQVAQNDAPQSIDAAPGAASELTTGEKPDLTRTASRASEGDAPSQASPALAFLYSLHHGQVRMGPSDWHLEGLHYRNLSQDPQNKITPWTLQGVWKSDAIAQWFGASATQPAAGESKTPLTGRFKGALLPAAEDLQLDLQTLPSGARPMVRLDWNVAGLYGQALPSQRPGWWPQSWSTPSLQDLQGGRFSGRTQAQFYLPPANGNREAWTQDLLTGFGVEWLVQDLEIYDRAIGDPLLAIASIDLDAKRVSPWRAQAQIERLICQDVRLETWNDKELWHALGHTWREQVAPSVQSADDKAKPIAELSAHGSPYLGIDSLQINGLDWVHTDHSVIPPVRIPIRNGEVEVLRLTSPGHPTPLPLRLHALADAGTVRAPLRGNATRDIGDPQQETRRAFDRIEARGRMTLLNDPDGWLQLDVIGLELAPLRGWFEDLGISMNDGLLDMRNALRFRGPEGLAVDSRSSVEHLDARDLGITNLKRDLRLPEEFAATLARFVDTDGHTQIPLRFEITGPALHSQAIDRDLSQGARHAFSQLATEAKAQARGAIQAKEALFGGSAAAERTLSFDPGSARLGAEAQTQLQAWGAKNPAAKSDRTLILAHQFGFQDLERANVLASPPPEQLMPLLRNLRLRKAELARKYVEASALAREQLQYGTPAEAKSARAALVQLDHDRGETEQAIDHVLDLLAPGAERRQARRTRSSALDLAQARQKAVQEILATYGWSVGSGRAWIPSPELNPDPDRPGGLIELRWKR